MQPSITTPRSRFDPHHVRLAAAIAAAFIVGMLLGGLAREVNISNPFADDAQPAIVAHVPAQAGDGVLAAQHEGISAGPLVITDSPSLNDHRFMEQNLYLPESVAHPSKTYPLDWQRFLDVNGITGALTEPVVPMEQQRFIDMNTYLPGYAVETPATAPDEEIRAIKEEPYLPSHGNGFIDIETPPVAAVDRSNTQAYYEDGLGEGWFANGKPAEAVDTTSLRAVGSWVNEGSGEGWVANGKPADDTTVTIHSASRGATTLR